MIVPDDGLALRGYCWKLVALPGRRVVLIVRCLQALPYDAGWELTDLYGTSSQGKSDLAQLAAEQWPNTHEFRRSRSDRERFYAIDLIPWSIHEIEDETAYQRAIEAFNRERQVS